MDTTEAKAAYSDPAAGTVIAVLPGDTVKIAFHLNNNTGYPIRFAARVTGVKPEYAGWFRSGEEALAAPWASKTVSVEVTPPANAAAADAIPFSLSLLWDDEEDRAVPLRLLLQPRETAAQTPAAPVEAAPVEADSAPAPPASEPTPPPPPPPAPETPFVPAAPEAPPTAPRPSSPATASTTGQAGQSGSKGKKPAAKPAEDPPVSHSREGHGQGQAQSPETPPASPPKPRPAAAETEAPPVVTLDPKHRPAEKQDSASAGAAAEAESASAGGARSLSFVGEPVARNPADNSAFELRPGATQIIVFEFLNSQKPERERSYVLDIDALLRNDPGKREWVELVRSEVNLPAGVQGELYVRLKPPVNAEPGDYEITLLYGPREGPLRPRRLRLKVLAIPAVRITAKTKTVREGPFPRGYVDFMLQVEQAGNSDTAFRVAVVDPDIPLLKADSSPSAKAPNVYENGPWRYTLDKELDNLKSPGYGRAAEPSPVRLRVERRGPWWLGIRESHTVTVRAVPVTDTLNAVPPAAIAAGDAAALKNTVTLTAQRYRLVPFPALLLIPLLLLLLPLFSSAPSDLAIVRPSYLNTATGTAYIVGAPSGNRLEATVRWAASPFTATRLSLSDDTVAVAARSPKRVGVAYPDKFPKLQPATVRVTNLWGSGESAKVFFLNTRPDTPLEIVPGDDSNRLGKAGDTYGLSVPAASDGWARFGIHNNAKTSNQIVLVTAKQADSGSYVTDGLLPTFTIPQGGTAQVKVQLSNRKAAEDEIVLVTSDSQHPIVKIRLFPE